MGIQYDEKNGIITIHTDHSTYQMKADPSGYLLHLYYGSRIEKTAEHLLTFRDRGFSGNPRHLAQDRTWSLDVLPQEFPVRGNGDFRSPALVVRDEKGDLGCDLRFVSAKVTPGKYRLQKLPSVFAEEEEAETLEILLRGKAPDLEVRLLYGVLPRLDIITRSGIVCGREKIVVEKAQSSCLDFLHGDFERMVFYGRHGMERIPDRGPVTHGSFAVGSRRGFSSHQYNPFMILMEPHTTEDAGRCWSMQLVYSGGFLGEMEKDQYDQTRMQMGLMEEGLSYPLKEGEELELPEVIISFSGEGLSRLSQNHHRCIREHVCRTRRPQRQGTVLLNSWEASYYDFDGEKICRMAEEAKSLGMDMIVMDDGWFGERTDDRRALGDWEPNEKRLGCSLGKLSDRIHAMGMKFGIWMEPEMVSEDSDLFREHPDWAMVAPGRDPVVSRDQLVLDYSRDDVVEEMLRRICRILDEGKIDYLKWDANRSIADIFSAVTDPGKILYDYMTGLYRLLDELTKRYPDLLVEGCCGGGGRFDAGMLQYAPQIWCSDNMDSGDQLMIRYGTSFGYPSSTMGSHVPVDPACMTGRSFSLHTRGVVAMAGTFGYELDPEMLTEEEREEIREQIRIFRQDSDLIFDGRHYRLSDPGKDPVTAWEHISTEEDRAVIGAVVTETHGNMQALYIRPKGLVPEAAYRIEELGISASGAALMDSGFPLPEITGDHPAFLFHLTRVDRP